MTLKNSGTTTWPATTHLHLIDPANDRLYDPSWDERDIITTLGTPVAPGQTGTLEFDVMTPLVDEETPIFEEMTLDDSGQKFGDIQVALTVVPGATEDESGDGSEDLGEVTGGCSATGPSSGLLVLLAFMGLGRARRRRTA
jgi:MYXO-CTERM domain-containing protein